VNHGEQQAQKPAKRFELARSSWSYQQQQQQPYQQYVAESSEIQQESLYIEPLLVVPSHKKPSQYQHYYQGPTLQNVIEPPARQPPLQRPSDSRSLAAQINALCVQENGQFPYPQDCRKFVNCWKVKNRDEISRA
jgi:hypothetical protein